MKLKMTIEEALEFADEWSRGLTLNEGSQGWRVVCLLLAEEVRRQQPIEAAARNLVKVKGRYHTEQAFKALAALLANAEAKGPRSGPA